MMHLLFFVFWLLTSVHGDTLLCSSQTTEYNTFVQTEITDLCIIDNWQDAVKQIVTVTASGMAGLNPQYTAHGWQQAQMQINYNREEIRKKAMREAEAEHSKKAMQDAEAKEIAKERARQNAEREAKAKAEQRRKVPLTKAQKDAYEALAHDVTHPFGDIQEDELLGLFDRDIGTTNNSAKQDKTSNSFIRPPSPTIQDTSFQRGKKWVSDVILSVVPDSVKTTYSDVMRFYADAEAAMPKNDASVLNRIEREANVFTQFERLFHVLDTSTEYTKAFARRGIRCVGVDEKTAQDIVSIAELSMFFSPITNKGIGLGVNAVKKVGEEVVDATRFAGKIVEDSISTNHSLKPAYARSRTFDRSYAAPKRAHSSIFFQERSSHFESQRFSQSSKASAAPRAQQAPAAGATVEKISRSKTLEQAAQDVRDSFNGKLNTKGKPYSEWYIERQMKGSMGEKASDILFERAGFEKLASKLPGNKGIDGVYVKWKDGIVDGVPEALYVVESKFAKSGKAAMNMTKRGQQMDQPWLEAKIKDMAKSTDLVYKELLVC